MHQLLIDILHSFTTDEEAKPLDWLLELFKEKGAIFVGSKAKAKQVGFPEEWSETYGGFWVLDKTAYKGKLGYYSLVGPGELEEILEDIITEQYPQS
jgi:hypothetical protein